MFRPILTEVALFLLPFAAYAAFLWVTRAGLPPQSAWSASRLAWLLTVALVLMLGSFLVLAQFGGAPPNSTYVPARVDNGQVQPGQTR